MEVNNARTVVTPCGAGQAPFMASSWKDSPTDHYGLLLNHQLSLLFRGEANNVKAMRGQFYYCCMPRYQLLEVAGALLEQLNSWRPYYRQLQPGSESWCFFG